MTATQSAEHLDENRHELHARRRDHWEVAPPVERVWSEKEEGQKRPRGTPGLEDQRGQRAVVRILAALFEPAWQAFSPGCRTGPSQHPALHELREQCRKLHSTWRVEADGRGCFAPLDWSQLRAFMQQRVQDGGLWRRSGTWLHAGGREAGALRSPDKGTPQGGVVSPI